MKNTIRFIHLSDTHIGPNRDYLLQGVNTYEALLPLVQQLRTLPFKPDFIVHTGDVATDPDATSYKLYSEMVADIDIPIYYVTGNHDDSSMIKQYLTMGEKDDLSNELNTYSFTMGEHRFLTIDARGPDDIDPHGTISDEHMQIINNELSAHRQLSMSIFIHFPALALDSPWIDTDMLLLNGDEFHQMLVPYADRVRGVFFGHVHRGMHVVQDGILYSSIGSTCVQFDSLPGHDAVGFENVGRGFYNIVTLSDKTVIIKEQSVKL